MPSVGGPTTTAKRAARWLPGLVVRGSRGRRRLGATGQAGPASGQANVACQLPEPHLDNAGALGPLAGARTAENEDDQRLHEAVRAENKRPAGKQREAQAQDLQQPAAAAAQHTPRLCRRELTATRPAEARGGAARRGRAEPALAAAPPP